MTEQATVRWRALPLEEWPGLVCLLGTEGEIVAASPALGQLLGRGDADLRGLHLGDLVHPDDRPTLSAGGDQFEVRLRAGDGDWRHLVWYARAVDEATRVCVVEDLTPVRELERRHRVEAAAARSVAEAAGLDVVSSQVLRGIGRVGGWQAAGLWWVDDDRCFIRCRAHWREPYLPHLELESASERMVFVRGLGLPGLVWETREPAWYQDYASEAAYFPRAHLAARDGLRGACAVPVFDRGEVEGVLEFFSLAPRAPDPDLLQAMQTAGSLVRIAARGKGTAAVAYARLVLGRLLSLERSRPPVGPLATHRLELLDEAHRTLCELGVR